MNPLPPVNSAREDSSAGNSPEGVGSEGVGSEGVVQLLIESDPSRVRIALLEGPRLVEYHLEDPGSSRVGDVYLGRVRRLAPAIDAAFVDVGLVRNAFLHEADFSLGEGEELGAHQSILVQVFRDAMPNKGARVRRGVTLPGRHLVLLAPGQGVAISTRIEDGPERSRLTQIVSDSASAEVGWIVRTAAVGVPSEPLEREAEELLETWRAIRRRAAEAKPPALVHRDLQPVERWLRDRANAGISEIWVEGEAARAEVVAALDRVAPSLASKVREHRGSEGLFADFGVEPQVRSLLERRVSLPSGGSIVIEPTEALVAIDVNSGSDLGGATLEETALATNLEAAVEVARQVRLRDLAGIIVVDFIDLSEPAGWEPVLAALSTGLAPDPVATQVEGPVAFGLVAITRKRGRNDLLRRMTDPCPTCDGSGRVPAANRERDA